MKQVALSTDLNVITAEINSFKQVAGQSLFEIGKRLKHVKENDLAHGQFGKWLESIDFNANQASRFIKIYEELGNSDLLTSANIGFRNLLEIATMPMEERDKSQIVPSTGETKTVDEMTVRELREVKQALKAAQKESVEAEQRAAQAEAAQQLAIRQHSEQQDRLLQQIDELKQRKGRSPEDEVRLQQLIKENVELTQSLHKLQDELQERNADIEKQTYNLRKMKEALNKTRAYIEVDLGTALSHLVSIPDNREAIAEVNRFWDRLFETLERNRNEFLKILGSELEVLGDGTKEARKARSTVIIDHDS